MTSAERNARALQTQLPFPEAYAELHAIGVPDHEIAKRLGTTPRRLRNLMQKWGFERSPLLAEMAGEERAK